MISQSDELHLCSNNSTDMHQVHQFLVSALSLKLKGNQNHYHHIVSTLNSKQDDEMIFRLFISMSRHVNLLTKKPDSYTEIIQSIYAYDWKCEAKVSIALLNLLGSMVSSNVTFLIPTFHFIIASFNHPLVNQAISNEQFSSENGGPRYHKIRLHTALEYLLKTVPMGRLELYPILSQNFPHKSCELLLLQSYAFEILQIAEYFPGIQENILDLLFQKSLDLDVSIVIEESGEVKITEEIEPIEVSESENIFFLEPIEEAPKLLGFRYSKSEIHKFSDEVARSADKLDILLVLIINYLKTQIQNKKSEIVHYMFQYLLNIFEERVLTTHRSKFVQFVFFFLSGYNSLFGVLFVNRLKKIFFNLSNSKIKRQCSIMYLSSFISRSNFLDIKVISECYIDLLTYAHEYLNLDALPNDESENRNFPSTPRVLCQDVTEIVHVKNKSTSSNTINTANSYREVDELGRLTSAVTALQKHEAFYLCIQGLCYMTCFHGSDLMLSTSISSSIDFDNIWFKIFSSSLRPFDYCLNSIKNEFFNFVESSSYFDQLKSSESFLLGKLKCGNGKIDLTLENYSNENIQNLRDREYSLDSFFPFDPCLLLQVNEITEKYYRHWKDIKLFFNQNDTLIPQPNNDEDISSQSSNNSYSTSSLSYLRRDYSSSVMSVALSFYGKSEMTENMAQTPSNSIQQDGSDATTPFRRPRQYSIGSTGSW